MKKSREIANGEERETEKRCEERTHGQREQRSERKLTLEH